MIDASRTRCTHDANFSDFQKALNPSCRVMFWKRFFGVAVRIRDPFLRGLRLVDFRPFIQ